MFEVSDLIVYSSQGVCKIENIADGSKVGGEAGKNYYVIRPLFEDCRISVPVDSKVYMRSIISKDEAERLLKITDEKQYEAFFASSVQQLGDHYDKAIKSHDCETIIDLLMSIYVKRKFVMEKKQKFGQLDERYMKKAEDLIFNEFAAAMGKAKDEIAQALRSKVK